MHSPHSVPFREHVLTSYGRVVRIPMLLGVCLSRTRSVMISYRARKQDLDLAVSDPVALSAMFGTYREVYDLPKWNSE